MHMKDLRFTGDFPPLEVIGHLPNWEYALDEEHIEGQDETTIRPSKEQKLVAAGVAFTAGTVKLASGEKLIAMFEVEHGSIHGFTVHAGGNWAWAVRLLGKPAKWQPLVYEWLPEEERPPSVSLNDPAVFPLIVETMLPTERGSPIKATIGRGE